MEATGELKRHFVQLRQSSAWRHFESTREQVLRAVWADREEDRSSPNDFWAAEIRSLEEAFDGALGDPSVGQLDGNAVSGSAVTEEAGLSADALARHHAGLTKLGGGRLIVAEAPLLREGAVEVAG